MSPGNRNKFIVLTMLISAMIIGCQPADESAQTTSSTQASTQVSTMTSAEPIAANVNAERILNAAAEPDQWMTYGGTYDETRFSNLSQITTDNVSDLGLSWFADYDSNLQQQATPLYVDGVIYVSIPWAKVYAFDARTGEELWMYNPNTSGEVAPKICCGIVNRGIAAFEGKIYVGTLDGYLVAIDALTGEEVWRKLTIDSAEHYSITSAPRVVNGKVMIGNSGSEFGVRGYLAAYDANDGEELWRFYTVPGNPELGFENPQMEMAAATWSGEWWKLGGGGTVWDAIVYDAENNLVFMGTGNGTPWSQPARDPEGGDNLFIASIIAVDADTGEYAWHYQTSPGDTWDYDAVSPMMLVNLDWEGQDRRVLIQPCKNGMIYVLDAATGELLKADPFTAVNWNTGIDMDTGRPIEVPEARFGFEDVFNLAPGVQGAHGWHPNSYNPETGLIYISTQRAYYAMRADEDYVAVPRSANTGLDFGASFAYYSENPDEPNEFVGYVQGWDPVKGEVVWESELNQGPTGGSVTTAGGLVFQGGGTNNDFRAFDASTGEKLWSIDAQTPVLAAPISYEVDGTQYIALSVGGNNASNYYAPNHSRLLVFSLEGDAVLPPVVEYAAPQLNPPEQFATDEMVAAGAEHYAANCSICHGNNGATNRATFPNLTVSAMLHSQAGFDQIVLEGVRSERGMPDFSDKLDAQATEALRGYLVARATELMNAPAFGAPAPAARADDAHDDLAE